MTVPVHVCAFIVIIAAQIHSGDGFEENEPLGSTRQIAPNAVEASCLLYVYMLTMH